MSQRTVDVDTSKGSSASEKISETEIQESRAQKKARRAQVFERGVLGDRLHVDLPPHLHGEWVPNNTVDVHRKEGLGFRIDTEYAKQRALHDKGDAASYVGDCVFMVCDKEDKEIIDEIRQDRYNKIHGAKGGKQKEERDFVNQADAITSPVAESKVNVANPSDISAALQAANNNRT